MNNPIVGITGDVEGGRFSIKMPYVCAVEKAGGCPVFLPPLQVRRSVKEIAKTIDALLISGGGDINPAYYAGENPPLPSDNPPTSPFSKGGCRGIFKGERLKLVSDERFNFEKALLEEIITLQKPVLGICYGLQFLNVFSGGTLYQDLKKEGFNRISHKEAHRITIYKNSKLYYILGKDDIKVNSTHHQGIKELGRGLTAIACSEDNLIEAVELNNYPYYIGVQWHPERSADSHSQKLLKSFIETV